MKPILMIHEIKEWMFDISLENYILTFDDGLLSQYYYWKELSSLNTEKIFFISAGIIRQMPPSLDFPSSIEAHNKFFKNNISEDFMSIDNIKYLQEQSKVSIGAHAYYHEDLRNFNNLDTKVSFIKRDTQLMLKWFKDNLSLKPSKFCYPYNYSLGGIYKIILKEYGFTEFYGENRISIESLYETQLQSP